MKGNCILKQDNLDYCVVYRGGFTAIHKDNLATDELIYSWYRNMGHANRDIRLKRFIRMHK